MVVRCAFNTKKDLLVLYVVLHVDRSTFTRLSRGRRVAQVVVTSSPGFSFSLSFLAVGCVSFLLA